MQHESTWDNLRPLSAMDYTIAGDDPDVRGWSVVDSHGAPLGHGWRVDHRH